MQCKCNVDTKNPGNAISNGLDGESHTKTVLIYIRRKAL